MRYVVERNDRHGLTCWEVIDTHAARPPQRRIMTGIRINADLVAEALNALHATKVASAQKAAA